MLNHIVSEGNFIYCDVKVEVEFSSTRVDYLVEVVLMMVIVRWRIPLIYLTLVVKMVMYVMQIAHVL